VSRWACQGLEADLLQGVGEEPAPELDAVFGRASAGLEFVQHGFGAVLWVLNPSGCLITPTLLAAVTFLGPSKGR